MPTELEYWLVQWIGVYGFLLEQVSEDDERRVFVCYERLCGQSPDVWNRLCERLDIPPRVEPTTGFENRNNAAQAVEADRRLRDEASAIYEALVTRSSQQILS